MNPTVIGGVVFLIVVAIVILFVSRSSSEDDGKDGKEVITRQSQRVSVSGSGSIDRDCQGSWTSWSECSTNCGEGEKQRTYRVSRTKLGKGNDCEFENREIQKEQCNNGVCPVNCQGSWGEWGECSQSCGGGVRKRTFSITRPATNGGSECRNAHGEEQEEIIPNNQTG